MMKNHLQYSWSAGGFLAEFESLEEEESIKSMLVEELGYWIGLTDLAIDGTWRWQESHQEPSYTNWASGQPDNGIDEDCVCISGDDSFKGWYDSFCNNNTSLEVDVGLHGLCQKTLEDTSPVTTTTVATTNTTTTILTTTPITSTTILQSTTTGTFCDEMCGSNNSGTVGQCCSNIYCDCYSREEHYCPEYAVYCDNLQSCQDLGGGYCNEGLSWCCSDEHINYQNAQE